ncbi:HAMP domain-containing histidine kinase [Litorilinea aerophila]|uniref:histidine kinase n=1 Tax=Litorilinea aerophila TaxID=1204385 RepID=A0A540VDS5_9CHLR|nr:HAMP domain-containing sensor histidine kinase [Litorilinea aerophila]MCC9077398.1 HAMP domain-containing histidine kinase [Litorilinea aerophila]
MIHLFLRRYWLPLLLGVLGLLVLGRVVLVNAWVLVPEDVDVVVMVALLSAALTAAIYRIVQISMGHLRQRSIQQARQETLAEHRRFLSRLDHELKNPLTALRAGLRTLALTSLDTRQRQIVETLEAETLRLSRLVQDLRKLAELETHPLNLQSVSIPGFVENILQMEQERFESGQRHFQYRVETAHDTWIFDEDLLTLAVNNLLDNAWKYTRPGDTVELAVVAQQELMVRISDTGVGIPPEALPHIWEELYRAPQMEKIAGSGIGLALVKAIVERHGGRAEIDSEPGRGTTITLFLPPVSSP